MSITSYPIKHLPGTSRTSYAGRTKLIKVISQEMLESLESAIHQNYRNVYNEGGGPPTNELGPLAGTRPRRGGGTSPVQEPMGGAVPSTGDGVRKSAWGLLQALDGIAALSHRLSPVPLMKTRGAARPCPVDVLAGQAS